MSNQKKLTRAQEEARHAYRRALLKAVGMAAKGTAWRSIQGTIFREHVGWFISVTPEVYINQELTKARVDVKPMAIDPVFWDLAGLPENRKLPLSFRYNGAWACHAPEFAVREIEEDADPSVVADRLVVVADEYPVQSRSYTIEAFLTACQVGAARAGGYLPSLVATLVVMKREEEALAICDEAHAKGRTGGYSAPEGSFVEMAARWLRSSIAGATRH